jgi:hypothetical protein
LQRIEVSAVGSVPNYYLVHGEDAELRRAGNHVYKTHPRLWELGQAATHAKTKLRQQWETENRAS